MKYDANKKEVLTSYNTAIQNWLAANNFLPGRFKTKFLATGSTPQQVTLGAKKYNFEFDLNTQPAQVYSIWVDFES